MSKTHQNHSQSQPTRSLVFDEVLKHATAYFEGDELAATVWINKYALKDGHGNIYESSPDAMHQRMASEIARIELNYPNPLSQQDVYDLLKEFRYLVPQGGPMSGIGNEHQISSLSNCFVVGNSADSYGGIMRTDEEQIQLMKRRGGVGHDLSHIRPSGSPVRNAAVTSSGLVPFMERFSNSTREVAQGGRRGALMLTISGRHPNVEDFIDAKLEQGKITGANISVRIDDAFMKAIGEGNKYELRFPVESEDPPFRREVDARAIWKKIIHNAWKSAEPGILFWDTILRESVPDCYADLGYKTISTNPCGEIPLCAYDSCRLLAINLFSYVEHPFTDQASFDFDKFKKHARLSQRIMDDIIDLEIEKIDRIISKIQCDPENDSIKDNERSLWQKIREKCVDGRRTGIGITAEGDMLAAMGLRYGSDDAIAFSTSVHKILALTVYNASVDLAKERGAFPIYDLERENNNPFLKRLKSADRQLAEKMAKYGRRNIALLTIAPTGTTSLMTQTSSGIEPVFMVSYKRRKKVNPNDKGVSVSFQDENGDSWEEFSVFHPKFADWLEAHGYAIEDVKELGEEQFGEIIAKSPYFKATANEIDWLQKVKMQGAIQKWVDHSISVTINLPATASEQLVAELYSAAWKVGCKGVTVYREGSRSGVLVAESQKDDLSMFNETHSPKRPAKLEAEVVRFQNNNEKWIAVVGLLEGKPYEIFTGRAEDTFVLPNSLSSGWVIKDRGDEGENRYDFQYLDRDGYRVRLEGLSRSFDPEYWNYAKLISGVLRHGMPLPFAVDLVSGLNLAGEHINTWKNGVVRALKKFIPDGTQPAKEKCENCGDSNGLVYKEGCLICKSCGFTECL